MYKIGRIHEFRFTYESYSHFLERMDAAMSL